MFQKIPAYIVDDHSLFAASFAAMLERHELFRTTASFRSIEMMEKNLLPGKSAMLFLDYSMPDVNTLGEVSRLSQRYGNELRIVVVSSIENPIIIHQLFQQGVKGFLSKNADTAEIKECLDTIAAGKNYVSHTLREAILNIYINGTTLIFTEREKEVLQQINYGKTIEETAVLLNISRHTVVAHRRNMMEKAKVNSSKELLKKAREWGLI